MLCSKSLITIIAISCVIIMCDLKIISNFEKHDKTSESRLLFNDIGKWFETFLGDDDCSNKCNSTSSGTTSNSYGQNSNNNGASDNNGPNAGGSNNNENNSNTSSNSEESHEGNGSSSGSSDPKKPNKSCRSQDFMIIAKCISMKCNKIEIECKELWMADSCIDRPKAIDVENCIRDVRAEINRLEGPISEAKSIFFNDDIMDVRRNRRFLFGGLDDLFDIFDYDYYDSTEHVNPQNGESITVNHGVDSTTSQKPVTQPTEQTMTAIENQGSNRKTSILRRIPDSFEVCQNEGTDAKIGLCVKEKCVEKGADCVYNGLFMICNGSKNIMDCINKKYNSICSVKDIECRIKFRLNVSKNINKFKVPLVDGKLRNIIQKCLDNITSSLTTILATTTVATTDSGIKKRQVEPMKSYETIAINSIIKCIYGEISFIIEDPYEIKFNKTCLNNLEYSNMEHDKFLKDALNCFKN